MTLIDIAPELEDSPRKYRRLASEERVAAGAAFLDVHYPGWDQRIDLSVLDVSDTDVCPATQICSKWWGRRRGYYRLVRIHGGEWCAAHGFISGEDTDTWCRFVRARRVALSA